jgi:D-lactate dehydrogenase
VLAHDLFENEELKRMGVQYVPKQELLRQADVISLHCPLLPSTYHIIDRDR